jgi:hypothetical protein
MEQFHIANVSLSTINTVEKTQNGDRIPIHGDLPAEYRREPEE